MSEHPGVVLFLRRFLADKLTKLSYNNYMKRENIHLGLFALDAKKIINFYTGKLGFTAEEERKVPESIMSSVFGLDSDCLMVKLRLEGIVLEIFSPDNTALVPRIKQSAGYNHWGITVADKVEYCRRLADNGVEIIKTAYKERFVYFIKDPEGNLIEVFER